ncbi:MAG TPA: hypothetical protein VHY35_11970 [Stellaceae bacterium]|nr:hypothetical protein [Stellaceae bacterium]
MANERVPEDPYRPTYTSDQFRTTDQFRKPLLDNELQPDPTLAEGPASSSRIAIFAVGIAVVLGAVFYGLNNTSINHANTAQTAVPTSTAQNTAQPSPTAAPPGMRDVTPHANTAPGVTTGAAPATKPATPPSAAPTGQNAARANGTAAPSK